MPSSLRVSEAAPSLTQAGGHGNAGLRGWGNRVSQRRFLPEHLKFSRTSAGGLSPTVEGWPQKTELVFVHFKSVPQ